MAPRPISFTGRERNVPSVARFLTQAWVDALNEAAAGEQNLDLMRTPEQVAFEAKRRELAERSDITIEFESWMPLVQGALEAIAE